MAVAVALYTIQFAILIIQLALPIHASVPVPVQQHQQPIITNRNSSAFSREYIGVFFEPWVSKSDTNTDTLAQEHLIAMVDKISSRFSRIMTRTIDVAEASNPDYDILKIPNAVANWNNIGQRRQASSKQQSPPPPPPMELLLQFKFDPSNHSKSIVNFDIAKELADRANTIYGGTVPALFANLGSDLSQATSSSGSASDSEMMATELLLYARSKLGGSATTAASQFFSYKLGSRLFEPSCGSGLPPGLPPYLTRIANLVDVVMIAKPPSQSTLAAEELAVGVGSGSLEMLTQYFQTCKLKFAKAAPALELEYSTGWQDTVNGVRNVSKLVAYWKAVDSFARSTSTRFIIEDAFDNPLEVEQFRTSGWWRLIENGSYYADPTQYVYEDKGEVALKEQADHEFSHKNYGKRNSSNQADLWMMLLMSGGTGGLILVILGMSACLLYKKVLRGIGGQRGGGSFLTKEELKGFYDGDGVKTIGDEVEMDPITSGILGAAYDKTLEFPSGSFEINRQDILGTGTFGMVYAGKLVLGKAELKVAVKTTKSLACPASALKGLLSEIKILSHVGRHPNVLGIFGANTDGLLSKGKVFVFTELCALGSLKRFLQSIIPPPKRSIIHLDLTRWCTEIACGMEYLTFKNVIHADLASRNVLLTEEKVAKISDFGLSRVLHQNYQDYVKTNMEPLPWRWMPPETLQRLVFNEKSDVWAYGVTMWEIYSFGETPYSTMAWDANWVARLDHGLRLEKPKYDMENRYALMEKCWEHDPQLRPTFSELRRIILEGNTTSPHDDCDDDAFNIQYVELQDLDSI